MYIIRKTISAAVALLAATLPGLAADYKIGTIEVSDPVARATLPGAPVSGGYMIIRNTGDTADRLVSVTTDFAGKTEIHEMAMENDVMKMREMENGIDIPAGGEVVLKPGGYHVMFMMLSEQLVDGETHRATLAFEKAGSIEVEFPVRIIKPMKKTDHSTNSSN